MSLHLEFEPHGWYMGFALRKWDRDGYIYHFNAEGYKWEAYTDNGNTYRVDMLQADTLADLKRRIRHYWWNSPHIPDRYFKQLATYHGRDYIPL